MTPSEQPFLPYGRQSIDDDDIAAVVAALKSDWLTTGPAVEHLERSFAKACGAEHSIACSSGTAALHLSAMALDLGPGDWVVVPTLTFLATANAVRYVGADVIFADVDPNTGLLTPQTLTQAINDNPDKNIRAVFPVHLNGQCADMVEIAKIAKAHDLYIVEDCCHAIGGEQLTAEGKTTKIGSCALGTISVFSLHPVKTVTMGEGGLITTNDAKLAHRLEQLRNHGMVRTSADFINQDDAFDDNGAANAWYYEMHTPGYNYRATDLQCALGTSQLAKLDGFVKRRAELVERYGQELAPLKQYVTPVTCKTDIETSWHLFVVLIDFQQIGCSRNQFMSALREQGIGSQVHYYPVHRQPYYAERYGRQQLPNADAYYSRCLSLPLYPDMNDADVKRVSDALSQSIHKFA